MQGSSATTRAKAGDCLAMPITDLKPQSMEVEFSEVRSGSDGFGMTRKWRAGDFGPVGHKKKAPLARGQC